MNFPCRVRVIDWESRFNLRQTPFFWKKVFGLRFCVRWCAPPGSGRFVGEQIGFRIVRGFCATKFRLLNTGVAAGAAFPLPSTRLKCYHQLIDL